MQHKTLQTEWDENRNQNGLDTMAKAVGGEGLTRRTSFPTAHACCTHVAPIAIAR